MKWYSLTFRTLKTMVAVLGLLIAGLAAAGQATAGCSDGAAPAKQRSRMVCGIKKYGQLGGKMLLYVDAQFASPYAMAVKS
jgi:hypothetical protein